MSKKIIMLAGSGISSVLLYNAIEKDFKISKIIMEQKVNTKSFLKKRIVKLGYLKVIGQILFQLIIPKVLNKLSKKRVAQIKLEHNLVETKIPLEKVKSVVSVNSLECMDYLRKENPDLIIVNGTRIISKEVLNCTNAIFLNTHAGITPKYRGVHGGYWALANEDPQNCGVTVHLVDPGIDTGGIIYQDLIKPSSKDNFVTYPYLQAAIGIKLMKFAIKNFFDDELKVKQSQISESKLWYHPTIWYYLYTFITKKVK